MTTDLILHYAPDNASLCVRLMLETMGTPYRTVLVDRAVDGQKLPSYLRLNPNGLIPTLETPDGPIFETGAILLWLADQDQGRVFPAPADPARGVALRRLFWVSNTLHPALRMLFYPDQYSDTDPELLRVKTRQRLTHYFDLLEADDVTDCPLLACYVAPILRWSALYGGNTRWFDLSKWPNLLTFAQRFEVAPFVTKVCLSEGLGPTAFSAPHLPKPPEGSAT